MNSIPSIPTATYRLQFHAGFTFQQARALIPYLRALGISHIYASPYFRAAKGSTHGYDVCDHNALNPELGTREDYDAFVATLHEHGMGQILDFVPNHMGVAESTNGWWIDVMENGPSSPFAKFFDIDWHPLKRELEGKVLLPILGDQYGRILENGELKLSYEDGSFRLSYYELQLPIAPRTARPILLAATEKLRAAGQEPPAELESISTALEYLPGRTETDPARIAERSREKEVTRKRLAQLTSTEPAVHEAILSVVEEIQRGGDTQSYDTLDELISAQPYRLSYWRVAAEEINYRRFFDINQLAAIRMEEPEVFETTHQLVFELIRSGAVNGLRIDHVDGLFHPRAYLEQLQQRTSELLDAPVENRPLYLLVEKILGVGERLRSDWPIHGTTGYEFGNQLTAVLIDPAAERAFSELYVKTTDLTVPFPEVAYRGKRLVMNVAMASEVNVLGHMLNKLSETNRWYRDFTLNALTTAVREVIASFPVYRTYLVPGEEPAPDDVRVIERAITAARRRNPALERTVFEFLREVLLPSPDSAHGVDEEARRAFVMKFQQCTGPITAKGVEDTAFYVYNRLVALNEVGGEPGHFGSKVEVFHKQNAARFAEFPQSMLATSTHDTKRSEDTRARIAALSEVPLEWGRAIRRWQTINRKHRRDVAGELAPDANEEYLLYQNLLGSWPITPMSKEEHQQYIERVQGYMMKALHEAKVNSSWVEPNTAWDEAVNQFVATILEPSRSNRFLASFTQFAEDLSRAGAINSLAQTVLKLTSPGVPDIYQGNEMWDFSLVDPDNRRPVDYELRQRQLASIEGEVSASELLENWTDGRGKLLVTQRILHFRRDNPALFQQGEYLPAEAQGILGENVIAFRRRHEGREILVVTPRLSSVVGFPPIGEKWQDTRLSGDYAGQWRELFTGATRDLGNEPQLASLLSEFPVAVWVHQ
ncbi:MAG TPA: malto-oligosyltrehalose synthase [Chthoniobacteraceae bacterium]|jgi:(1->4)-alpha-D-glucan 1-alpha-D-glucosylmutase